MEKKYFIVIYNKTLKVFDVATETKQFLDCLVQLGGTPNIITKNRMSKIMDGDLGIFDKNLLYSNGNGWLQAFINNISVHLGE